jgi:P27 family predicted phage terminase small subunit
MKRGRPKKTENIIPIDQAVPVLGTCEPPEHLDEVAKRIFRRVVKLLTEMNIFTLGDADLVADYAEWSALGLKHNPNVAPTTFETANGYRGMSPDYIIWRDCKKTCQSLLNDMGMSPASRTRVAAVVKEETDALAEFIKRRNAKG